MSLKYRFGAVILVFSLVFLPKYILGKNDQTLSLKYQSYSKEVPLSEFIDDTSKVLSKSNNLNFGLTENTHWIEVEISNTVNLNGLFLQIPFPLIDDVLLIGENNGKTTEIAHQGQQFKFSDREIKTKGFVFKIPNEYHHLYLKVSSKKPLSFPILLVDKEELSVFDTYFILFSGIFLGIIFVMAFYNLFIYFSVRDSSYIYYVLYIATLGITQGALQGTFDKFLWPDSPWFSVNMVQLTGAVVGLFSVIFIKQFLHLSSTMKRLAVVFNVFMVLEILAFILVFFDFHIISHNIINGVAGTGAILAIYAGAYLYRKGNKSALYFLLGWSLFIVSVFLFVIKDYFKGDMPEWLNYVILIGASIEVVLLSFALADKINTYRKQVQISQKKELEASLLNEKLIREQNVILEKKVKERTSELENANQNLTSALASLKEAQSQLVEAEKMASLGQLTAGIAHEINNPINFVSSNVKPIRQDIDDIFSLIEDIQSNLESNNYQEGVDFIKQRKEHYDYSFLKDELNMLVNGLKDGADRTIEIVRGLKTFSRLDESDLKKVNLIDGLESTLILLRNKHKDSVKIEKNFEQLPEVECLGGKMNQVFMNIITNGIQALTEDKKVENPTLVISTKQLGDFVLISIKDNGPGIPDHVKERIFEPFFTTKPVGQGTGLGLSIVYKIVESHGGTLDVVSRPGEGAEFRITLPIENNNHL